MSRFNTYARRMDKEVKKYRDRYKDAKKRLREAQNNYAQFREEHRFKPLNETSTERIEKDLEETRLKQEENRARNAFEEVRKERFSILDNAKKIRNELSGAINEAFCADPSALDSNVMTLLDSDILTAKEMKKFADAARESGNHTMVRIIAGKAKTRAEEIFQKEGNRNPDYSVLNGIVHDAQMCDGRAILSNFDSLVNVAKYCVGNPEIHNQENEGMFDRWEQLTESVVENF